MLGSVNEGEILPVDDDGIGGCLVSVPATLFVTTTTGGTKGKYQLKKDIMYNIKTFTVLCHEYYTDHFFGTFFCPEEMLYFDCLCICVLTIKVYAICIE